VRGVRASVLRTPRPLLRTPRPLLCAPAPVVRGRWSFLCLCRLLFVRCGAGGGVLGVGELVSEGGGWYFRDSGSMKPVVAGVPAGENLAGEKRDRGTCTLAVLGG
jgi:hypothetical protein